MRSITMSGENSIASELKLRHVFGLKEDVTDNVHYIEENVIVYPCGRNIVIYDTITKTQRFIVTGDANEDSASEITAIAVSPNRRTIAAAFRTDTNGKIDIYDVRTLKLCASLINPEVSSSLYTSLKFSPDSKYLLCIGGEPDFILSTWDWEAKKVLQSESIAVKSTSSNLRCSFSPHDPSVLVLTGYKLVNFFKIDSDSKLQHIETKGKIAENYLCHEWLASNLLLVGTESGKVLLFQNFSLLKEMSTTSDLMPVTCIKVCSRDKSFLVGTGSGKIEVFQRQHKDDELANDFKKQKEFVVQQEQTAAVTSLSVSPTQRSTCIALENSQMYTLTSFNADVLNPRDMKFQPLGELGHHATINGMDICQRKPLVVTVGQDKSVRVWDYMTKTLENVKYFAEEPLSVAFHPSGFHLVIGFPDKLRFFNILMDDLRPVRDFPLRNVREVRFSNGGNLFAAAQNSLIHVFETFTCKPRPDMMLKCHSSKVASIYWSEDDESICSTGADGHVFLTKLGESREQVNNYFLKGVHFTCALSSYDEKMYAVGKGSKIVEIIDQSPTSPEIDGKKELSQICIGHRPQRMFFVADMEGNVWSYKYPFAAIYCVGYSCHADAVSKMCISSDDKYLFTVSRDGTLAFWDIISPEFRSRKETKEVIPWSEEVMVTKSDLEEKHVIMHQLQSRVKILILQNDSKLRQHEMQYQKNLKDSTQKFQLKLEEQKNEYESLREEKADMQVDFQESEKRFFKESKEEFDRIDMQDQNSLLEQIKMYNDAENEYQEAKLQHRNRIRTMEKEHREATLMSKRIHREAKNKAVEKVNKAVEDRDTVMRQFKETKRQLELDTDLEIEQLVRKYEAKLNLERDSTLRLKGENGIMKKRFASLKKHIIEQIEQKKEIEEESLRLEDKVSGLQEEIARLKRQIKKMDQTISERETQIYDLKKSIQELEKHKYVLDYSIKQQNLQIEPREKEIAQMKAKVLRLDGELERRHSENGKLEDEIKMLKKKLSNKQKEDQQRGRRLRRLQIELEQIKKYIQVVVEVIQHPAKLDEEVTRICERYATINKSTVKVADKVQSEYKEQETHLRKTVKELKRKLRIGSEQRRKNVVTIMKENMDLLKEIKVLRANLEKLRLRSLSKEVVSVSSKSQAKNSSYSQNEAAKIVELQRRQIENLRQEIQLASVRLGITVNAGTVSKARAEIA